MTVVDVDAIRAQIDRVTQSKTFENSEVHRRLLQYLAEKSLSGDADRLKEYAIGLEAFGKPPTYDPKQDSIVRLQVGRLRQKLAVYYQSEAQGDPILLKLPKGAFKLEFEPFVGPAAPVDEVPAGGGGPRARWLMVALAVVSLWAVVASGLLYKEHREASATVDNWTPDLEALWAPFLHSKRALLVCLGNPLFVRLPDVGFFRDPKANDWSEVEKSTRLAGIRKALGEKEILPNYNFTGVGEASAGFLLAKLLAVRKPDLLLTRSSILSWQQIVDNDLVFVGPPKFNVQLQAAAMAQDIVVESGGIRNLKPHPGEPVFLEDHLLGGKSQEGETHALISRTPGPSGAGEFLVIAGNASPDTFAAAEWLTEPARAHELVQRLRTPAGDLPRHFQVVIQVAFKQGIPVQSSYVFHHVR